MIMHMSDCIFLVQLWECKTNLSLLLGILFTKYYLTLSPYIQKKKIYAILVTCFCTENKYEMLLNLNEKVIGSYLIG